MGELARRSRHDARRRDQPPDPACLWVPRIALSAWRSDLAVWLFAGAFAVRSLAGLIDRIGCCAPNSRLNAMCSWPIATIAPIPMAGRAAPLPSDFATCIPRSRWSVSLTRSKPALLPFAAHAKSGATRTGSVRTKPTLDGNEAMTAISDCAYAIVPGVVFQFR